MNPVFYCLALVTLVGAVAAMSLRNPVHCVLCLVVTFAGLAGIYLGLGSQLLGLAQILVYVGAVAILVVFVLLLTREGTGVEGGGARGSRGWKSGLGVAVGVGVVLIGAVVSGPAPSTRAGSPVVPTVRDAGIALMTDFVLPLQVVGVLLTAAMIGAAVLAMRERPSKTRSVGDQRRGAFAGSSVGSVSGTGMPVESAVSGGVGREGQA